MSYHDRLIASLMAVGFAIILFAPAVLISIFGGPSPGMKGDPRPRPLDPDDPLDDPGCPFC